MECSFSQESPLCRFTSHHDFNERNRCVARLPLNLQANGKMANEISKLRAIRDLTEHLTQSFPSTDLQLGLEHCKVFTSLQEDEKNKNNVVSFHGAT